ncbi:MAG: hypothetical protein SGPRY_012587, partial [Prymnesium sp.]
NALGNTRARLNATRERHKAQELARSLKEEDAQKAARERLESLLFEREDVHATNARLRTEIEGLKVKLQVLAAENPPGALEKANSRIARQAQLLQQQGRRCNALRDEMEAWKTRALHALQCEKEVVLHSGPAGLIQRVEAEEKAKLTAEEKEERTKLRLEIEYWKNDAVQVRSRDSMVRPQDPLHDCAPSHVLLWLAMCVQQCRSATDNKLSYRHCGHQSCSLKIKSDG